MGPVPFWNESKRLTSDNPTQLIVCNCFPVVRICISRREIYQWDGIPPVTSSWNWEISEKNLCTAVNLPEEKFKKQMFSLLSSTAISLLFISFLSQISENVFFIQDVRIKKKKSRKIEKKKEKRKQEGETETKAEKGKGSRKRKITKAKKKKK